MAGKSFWDFNGDGKVDVGEQWLWYKIFEDCVDDETDSEPSPSRRAAARPANAEQLPPSGAAAVSIPDEPSEDDYLDLKDTISKGRRNSLFAALIKLLLLILFYWYMFFVTGALHDDDPIMIGLLSVSAVFFFGKLAFKTSDRLGAWNGKLAELEENYRACHPKNGGEAGPPAG